MTTCHEAQRDSSPYVSFTQFIDGQFITRQVPTPAKQKAMMAGS